MNLLPAAILAGGLATRLGSLTVDTPKCLLDVAGRPFIHHQLLQLRGQGVRRVILCVGYLSEHIVETVGDGSKFDLEVVYSFDGPDLRGTAGAVKRALPLLGPAFFVLYGDSFLRCSYAAIQQAFETAGKLAMMTIFRNKGLWDTSNVEYHDGRIINYDKNHHTSAMQYIDYGLGVWNHHAFNAVLETGSHDLAEVSKAMLLQGELAAFEVTERFYEIGSMSGLEETRKYLAG